MTFFPSSSAGDLRLNYRWFAVFLALQAALLTGSLLYSRFILYLTLAGIAVSLFSAMVLLYPWLIIPIIVATTALDSTGRLMNPSGSIFHLTGFHLAFGLTIIAVLANVFLRRRVHFPPFELKIPLLLLLFSIAVSLTYSPNQPEATIGFVRIACLVLFLYLTQVIVDSKKAVATVLWSMAVATVGGAVMGVYQVITGQFHLPAKVIQALGGNVPRATGMFHNPNIFATFLMSGILPMMAVLLNHRLSLWKQAIFALSIIAGTGGLLASFSRSSWMATLVGIVVILYLSRQLRYLFILAFAGALGILALREFVPFAEYIFERFISIFTLFEEFGQIGTTSSTARVLLVIAALGMFLDHPVLGIGWRAFPKVFSHYAPSGYPWWSRVNESHTVFATVLAELGLVGFAAFAWFISKVLYKGFTSLPQMQDSYLRAVTIGLIATFIGFQVSQSFNGDFSDNTFWFYTGMLYAVIRLEREGRRE